MHPQCKKCFLQECERNLYIYTEGTAVNQMEHIRYQCFIHLVKTTLFLRLWFLAPHYEKKLLRELLFIFCFINQDTTMD